MTDGASEARRIPVESALRQTEAALRESEERYHRLFDGMTEGFLLAELIRDEAGKPVDFRILEANRVYESVLGCKREEAIGRTLFEMFPGLARDRFEAIVAVAQTGEPHRWRGLFAPTGRYYENVYYSPRPGQLAGIFTDITERVQAEQSLRESEGQFRAIFDSIQEGAILLDDQRRCLKANPAAGRVTGLPPEALVGRLLEEFVDPAFPLQVAWTLFMQTGRFAGEVRVRHADGSYRTLDASGTARILPGGHLFVGHDITERKKMEEALCQSESRFRLTLKNSPVLVTMQDTDLVYQWVYNTRTRRPEEVVGKTDADLFAPDEAAALSAAKRQVIETGTDVRRALWLTSNGQRVYVDCNYEPVRDAAGRIIGVAGASVNLTEQKRAEDALRESEEQFRALTQNLVSAVALVNERGEIAIVNQAFLRLFDLPEDADLLNLNSRDWGQWRVFDEAGRLLDVDEHPVRKAARTRTPVRDVLVAMQCPGRTQRKWLLLSAEPILDAQGNLHRLICTYHDITARKKAEETLRESEARMQQALRASCSYTFEWRPASDAVMRSDNCASILGLRGNEALHDTGQSYFQRLHPEDRERFTAVVSSLSPASPRYTTEYRLVRGDGGVVMLEETGQGSFDKAGRLERLVGVTTDITARKQAEEALRKLNETLEQRVNERTVEVRQQADQLRALATELTQAEQQERRRLAKILHDHIQQLLVSAQMQLSLVKRGNLQVIQSVAQGIDSTLAEALNASRSLTVELCPPVLHQSGLAAALSWLALRLEEKHQFKVHVRATNDAEPATPELRAFLFESVREVLLNAVKHSGVREAHVAMLRTNEGQCKLIIEDQGKGFDPASVKPGPAGGFGLFSIQQRLMHLGGQMEIESAPGQGTKATVTVPIGHASLAQGASAGLPGTPGAVSFKEKGQRIGVLLVDDHKIMRQGLTSLLQFESDIEIVGEADNGERAVELARQHRPDVVVMDVNMPVMDGIEATKILSKEMPQVKVIGLSMHLEKDAANAMREAGAVAYLTKGGPSEELAAAIRACGMPGGSAPR